MNTYVNHIGGRDVPAADGRTFTVGSVLVVDEKKLLALPDATALQFFRAGELHLISMHLLSLSNMQRLVDKIAQRTGIPAAPGPQAQGPGS